ncbi:hypothetical protein GCM10010172_46900 [Paractinoplanes ferrugineus]|uniref:AB hydrolase-1 domain-containing protein n=1 Tax=Paractinoplanes ferrugineus TaxID=113564 RepID=A0A919IY27_9ACTN|nr:alpha/beta fold hydrolase [Actinoplanes ferrugineus]GIE10274.1 hypothetical protein Afe05nite_21140 [Actinoplanes ferrugineus]
MVRRTEEDLTGFDCAAADVPLDYDRPSGATTTIAPGRRPADDPARRIGTIFVNPGGPGGAGRGLVTAADQFVPPEVRARFDIVGFDPRGIGAGCVRDAGPVLEHMSTLTVAKDLDQLRKAVGDREINYIGFSYGTMVGATYANLFPENVRALVIDGNVDPECDKAGARCAFSGNARPKFDALRDRLRQGPADVSDLGGGSAPSTLIGCLPGDRPVVRARPPDVRRGGLRQPAEDQ